MNKRIRRLIVMLLSYLYLSYPASLLAQSQSISGRILNMQGKAVSLASVSIAGSTQGTISDEDGTFRLSLTKGKHSLLISCLGYQSVKRIIEVSGPQTSELEIVLSDSEAQLDEVTVTATRTLRSAENVPMPVQVIRSEQIEQIGALRLKDVLLEQTGLQIVSDHGSGLQMQGLSSDYIMILIDGEPLIGRTAGTLDLDRIAVDNIARVEIIKGPSSSLYGSEAMAGVINIITKEGSDGFNASLRSRYRSFNTWDMSTQLGYKGEKASARFFANRLSTDGYDLNKETLSMTAAPYQAYTLQTDLAYNFSDQLKLNIKGRYYQEEQENQSEITEEGILLALDETGEQSDWNLMPTLSFRPNDSHRIQLRSYTSGYSTEADIHYQSDGKRYGQSYFDQLFNRSELQYDWYISDSHISTFGLGHTRETVEATRYDEDNLFTASYGFVQHQWIAGRFDLVAGGRFDTHSEYQSRFSPKLAAAYRINDQLKVQASLGGGYKAPDFRQLLLNFTNSTVGYTVIGAQLIEEKIAELQAQGQIETIFIDPNTLEAIKAESSLAYNLGINYEISKDWRTELNLFRNEIKNLINSAPIASKTNGQSVFSYFNTDEVVTQGLEWQSFYQISSSLKFSVGYQYLDTRDKAEVERIKNGEVFRRNPTTQSTERVKLSDYGGLVNRSRHSGNAKLLYINNQHKYDASLRAIYRGRWGIGDANGNGVIDTDSEYADSYWLLNFAANKALTSWLKLEAGINNVLDKTNSMEPNLAGRIWYAGLHLRLP